MSSKKIRLVEKYDIPLANISYEYIDEMDKSKIKELENIIKVLRSRQEGYFPDLLNKAEDKLREIHPKSSLLKFEKSLQYPNTLDSSTWSALREEMMNWTKSMNEDKLVDGEYTSQNNSSQLSNIWPPIRINDENPIKHENNTIKIHDNLEFNAAEEIKVSIKGSMTKSKRAKIADEEKNKGNEFFKVGDTKEALSHYNRSIEVFPTISAYNNRAMALLKLEQYKECINDCNRVILEDKQNVKALYRRGMANFKINNFSQACKDFTEIMKIDPYNLDAKIQIDKLKKLNIPLETTNNNEKQIKSRPLIEELN